MRGCGSFALAAVSIVCSTPSFVFLHTRRLRGRPRRQADRASVPTSVLAPELGYARLPPPFPYRTLRCCVPLGRSAQSWGGSVAGRPASLAVTAITAIPELESDRLQSASFGFLPY